MKTNELIERLDWLATYLRDESLVYNDKAFGLHDELKKAAERIRKLEADIENACLAASDTQPSWKHRCYVIMDNLGQDYGDPDWEMPDDRKRSDMLEERIAKLEAVREDAADRIEWHKAETTRLLAEKEIAVFFLKALVGGKFKPEYRIFEEADKTLKALAACGDES